LKARKVKKLDPAASLAENSARTVLVRLDELRSFATKAVRPSKTPAQHDMRIAAKRLRYVLELTEFCFGASAATARRSARDLQDVLGALHDCEVMLPRLGHHVAELRESDASLLRTRAKGAPDLDPELVARAPNRTAYRGLEVLAVYLEARKRILHDRFCALWAEQERGGVWDRLERDADRVLRSEQQRRYAAERAAAARQELERARSEERAATERAARAAKELAEARVAAEGGLGAEGGTPGPVAPAEKPADELAERRQAAGPP
jgi:CHAD domain